MIGWNEKDLFDYLKQKYYADLKSHSDKYCYSDCYSKYFNMEIELKCRNEFYDYFILEEFKYKNLFNKAYGNYRIPYYICSSPKGVFKWCLIERKYNFSTGFFPKTTFFEDNDIIGKSVTFLHVSEGEKLG